MRSAVLFAITLALAGCAGQRPQMTAAEGRALIGSYLPQSLADKEGWAADIHTPMVVMEIPLSPDLATVHSAYGFPDGGSACLFHVVLPSKLQKTRCQCTRH